MATASNKAVISYTNIRTRPTHIGIWSGATFIAGKSISPAYSAGINIDIPINDLDIVIPNGDLNAAGAQYFLGRLNLGSIGVSLHSANPGTSGASEISGGGYSRATVPTNGWNIT